MKSAEQIIAESRAARMNESRSDTFGNNKKFNDQVKLLQKMYKDVGGEFEQIEFEQDNIRNTTSFAKEYRDALNALKKAKTALHGVWQAMDDDIEGDRK